MTMTLEQEREAFESWLVSRGFTSKPAQRPNGKYVQGQIQGNWIAWQARSHLTQPAQSVNVSKIPDAKPLPDLMMASYHEAIGWNAYREAMLNAALQENGNG